MTSLIDATNRLCDALAALAGTNDFIVRGTLAIALVSLICGAVGSLVVGNRMAFFSDALAHCAIAGVSLGILSALSLGLATKYDLFSGPAVAVMIVVGVLVGVGINYVRETTALASDTVIGVFFAGALGLGAVLIGMLKLRTNQDPDIFLFGSPNLARAEDLLRLAGLLVITAGFVAWRYNQLVFASFSPSLARSRQVPLRLYNYLFIALLAVVVNMCITAVGVLLINAMLVVPAATASNLSRNLRQMFWWTVGLSLATGLVGQWLNTTVEVRMGQAGSTAVGASGSIVILSVFCFAVSMAVSPRLKGRQAT